MARPKSDPFKYKKTEEIEQLVTRNSRRIHSIADELSLKTNNDAVKDKLFKIMELADCNVTVLDYPGLGH